MKRRNVREKMEEMVRLMREEQALRLELASLDLSVNSRSQLEKALGRQDNLVAQIGAIRQEKMMPIVREMLTFIGSKLEQQAAREAAA